MNICFTTGEEPFLKMFRSSNTLTSKFCYVYTCIARHWADIGIQAMVEEFTLVYDLEFVGPLEFELVAPMPEQLETITMHFYEAHRKPY